MRNLSLIIITVLSFVIGFVLSTHLKSTNYSEEIQFIQAEKSDLFLSSLEEVKDYLDKGCIDGAKSAVSNSIDQTEMHLAEHVEFFPVGKYVSQLKSRDPILLGKLRGYKIDWKKKYTVKACNSGEIGSSKG